MKKTFYIALAFLATVFVSCDDLLDTKIDNSFGDDITWKYPDYALGVLNNAYNAIPQLPSNYGGDFLDVATDNAYSNNNGSALSKYVMGGITTQNNPLNNWKTAYEQFQNIHLFIDKGLNGNVLFDRKDPVRNEAIKKRSYGEAIFLRAWWGMELLQRFGGITADGEALGYPIVLKYLTDADLAEALTAKRDAYEVCAKQIMADCDTAFKYLPLSYSGSSEDIGSKQEGRASGKAALALKSRVALFAASPAYQPEANYAISTDSINAKWKRAITYAQGAITTGALGSYTRLIEDAYVGSLVNGATNPEFIFRKWFNNNSLEKSNYPPLFYGVARTNPSQNLVDAYHTESGFPISDPRSGYNPQKPYEKRDRRFELTFFYNNKAFHTDRPLEIYTTESGVRGRDVAGYDYNNSATGYYLRKFLSSKRDLLYNAANQSSQNDFHQFPLLRRAEMYFNLAEALNELVGPKGLVAGTTTSAYDIIKNIRLQNGITGTTYLDEMALDKAKFKQLILNERRVEFAFENQRFFDLRRHLLPLNESIYGVKIVKTATGFTYTGTDLSQDRVLVEARKLDNPKYYYQPIPFGEIAKNPNLKQNKGW